jgi:hypothetical protein
MAHSQSVAFPLLKTSANSTATLSGDNQQQTKTGESTHGITLASGNRNCQNKLPVQRMRSGLTHAVEFRIFFENDSTAWSDNYLV